MEFVKGTDYEDEFIFFMKESGEEFYRMLFCDDYEKILRGLFNFSGNPFSHRFAEFLKFKGEIVGMHLSYPYSSRARGFTALIDFSKVMGFSKLMKCAFKLLIVGLKDSFKVGDYYLSNIAVVPYMRGKGLGTLLMNRITILARESNSKRIILNVRVGNTGAIEFYKKRGFRVEKRIKLLGLEHLRMVKEVKT